MGNYSITDISISSDRHKLYCLSCSSDKLVQTISSLAELSVLSLNIGEELASFINNLDDYLYLGIDAYDFARKLLDRSKAIISGNGNPVLAIYNFGILLEPSLEIKAAKLLQEFSKSTSLVIIWVFQIDTPDILIWPSQNQKFSLNFKDTPLKIIQYEI